jgi:hypothetical protein
VTLEHLTPDDRGAHVALRINANAFGTGVNGPRRPAVLDEKTKLPFLALPIRILESVTQIVSSLVM